MIKFHTHFVSLISLVFVVLVSSISHAQHIDVLWAKSAGSTYDDQGGMIAIDQDNNVYVCGIFQSATINFGTYELTNQGSVDTYLAKYDSEGNILWATSFGGSLSDGIMNISLDPTGNIYLTGNTYSSTLTVGEFDLTNSGSSDGLIVVYNPEGEVIEATLIGGEYAENIADIFIDENNNRIIIGETQSTSLTLGSFTITKTANSAGFTAKYNASGDVIWAKSTSGSASCSNISLAVDIAGNAYVTGQFYNTPLSFGALSINNHSGADDVFLVKYASDGTEQWVKGIGANGSEYANKVVTDASGNIFLIGSFQSSTLTIGTTQLTLTGNVNPFWIKLDANGNVLWATTASGNGGIQCYNQIVDSDGNLYAMGYFSGTTATFGETTINNPSPSIANIFLLKYDTNGEILWAMNLNGNCNSSGFGLAVTADHEVYCSGNFSSYMQLGSTLLESDGSVDLFVMKFKDASLVTSIVNQENQETVVYPIPSQGQLHLKGLSEESILKIYNTMGTLIYKKTMTVSAPTIDLSGQAKGMYSYTIENAEGKNSQNGKLILE